MDACPRCGGDLEHGYVAHGLLGGLIWTTTPFRAWRRHPKQGSDWQMLTTRRYRPANVPASRCTRCQLALLDYGKA